MSNIDIAGYNRKGQLFGAANVSAKSVVAVSTTETGLILYNPPGSGKKLVLVHAGFVYTTAAAAVHNIGIGLMAANPALPTGLTVAGSGVLALDGSGNAGSAVGKAYDAATLPTAPVAVRWMWGVSFGSAVALNPTAFSEYLEGGIVVVPGAAAALIAVTTTAVGMGSFAWVEVPQ
jgi:hypothetical protein